MDIYLVRFWLVFLGIEFCWGMVLGLDFNWLILVEQTNFPIPGRKKIRKDAWAVHQMKPRLNFLPKKPLDPFLCVGLELQVRTPICSQKFAIHFTRKSQDCQRTLRSLACPIMKIRALPSALKSHYNFLRKREKMNSILYWKGLHPIWCYHEGDFC